MLVADVSSSDVPVDAVVMAEAEWRYVGPVLGQPRLQDPAFTFDGRTVR